MSASRYAIGNEKFIEEAETDLKEMRLKNTTYGDIALPENDGYFGNAYWPIDPYRVGWRNCSEES